MIRQYLSNKNESAIVTKRKKFCKLNKASSQNSPSHQIFGRMHGALNIDENKN